ncbi:MAG: anion transporter [Deltaproteobacteria bacterium]|nr:anion transporter [Deltaproteobacteria bacterium]
MLTLTIFILTYLGVAVGRIPALTLDRTGIALLGAIAMVVFDAISVPEAVAAVDFPTILLLYALMMISAQLRLGGFYTWIVLRITILLGRPRLFLAAMMLTSAVLSAVLANDIICLAFTPVLCVALVRAALNPIPFLIGLAVSSNIGSAATIIGNPQNMLIGQLGNLHFGAFSAWCLPPSTMALFASYLMISWICRKNFIHSGYQVPMESVQGWPPLNPWQSTKGVIAVIILIILFFTPIPREISAIGVAGILLCSRKMKSRNIMQLVDWHLITLFCALFIVIQGITIEKIPAVILGYLHERGIDLGNLYILTGVSAVLSNMVSNVPATMLLTQFLDPSYPIQWYALAVSSTFAGNLIIIGSIANLIVIEQARPYGIVIGFKEHARVGIPVTLISLVILMVWMLG